MLRANCTKSVLPPEFGNLPRSASITLSHLTVSTGAAYFCEMQVPGAAQRRVRHILINGSHHTAASLENQKCLLFLVTAFRIHWFDYSTFCRGCQGVALIFAEFRKLPQRVNNGFVGESAYILINAALVVLGENLVNFSAELVPG